MDCKICLKNYCNRDWTWFLLLKQIRWFSWHGQNKIYFSHMIHITFYWAYFVRWQQRWFILTFRSTEKSLKPILTAFLMCAKCFAVGNFFSHSLSSVVVVTLALYSLFHSSPRFNNNPPFVFLLTDSVFILKFSQAMSGFLMMLTQNGKLLYISDNAAEYLGHSMVSIGFFIFYFIILSISCFKWAKPLHVSHTY